MKNRYLCRTLVVLAAMTALSAAGQAPRAGNDAARRDKNYYDPAAAAIVRSVELNHLDRAISEIQEKRWPSARADLEFILNYVANHPQALALLVEVCLKMNEADCPQPYFEKALRLFPETASTYSVYGAYLHRLGQVPKAIESYKRALFINPQSGQTHYNLGLAYFDTKEYDRANEEARRAYEMGIKLPGLRDKLIRAKQWNPGTGEKASATDASGEAKGSRNTKDAPSNAQSR